MKTTRIKTQIKNLNAVLLLALSGTAAVAQLAPADMVPIPAGSFLMGDMHGDGNVVPGGYPGGINREIPVHPVYVSGYCMDIYEVTWAKWLQVYVWANKHGYKFNREVLSTGEDHPVYASWYDAVLWCNARSEMENRRPAYYTDANLKRPYRRAQVDPFVDWKAGYRLPCEAEWEKAAKGGVSGNRFPWDVDSIDHSRANYFSTWCDGSPCYPYDVNATEGRHPAFSATNPVDYFAANAYGLFGMAGNASEWCYNWLGPYGSDPEIDPHGPATGSYRVVRGGHSGISAWGCRTSFRSNWSPEVLGGGIRCVLPLAE